jgi:hypothetical protein
MGAAAVPRSIEELSRFQTALHGMKSQLQQANLAVLVADQPLNADDFGLQPGVFNMILCKVLAFSQNLQPEPVCLLRPIAVPLEFPNRGARCKDIHSGQRVLTLLLEQFLTEPQDFLKRFFSVVELLQS